VLRASQEYFPERHQVVSEARTWFDVVGIEAMHHRQDPVWEKTQGGTGEAQTLPFEKTGEWWS